MSVREGTIGALRDECKKQGIGLDNQISYVLATVKHECGDTWKPIKEYGLGKGKSYGNPDPRTGKAYFGRGYVQLTWYYNYGFYAKHLGVDLLNDPDLVLKPEIALYIIVHGMKEGKFGRKLTLYCNESKTDFVNARRSVNSTDRAALIAGYAEDFLKQASEWAKYPADLKAIDGPSSSTEGAGCADGGGGATRTYVGVSNPTSVASAILQALGLSLAYRNSIKLRATLNVSNIPEILKLEEGLAFNVTNSGFEFGDGRYVAESIRWEVTGGECYAHMEAAAPDPDAPPPKIFVNDANAPMVPQLNSTDKGDLSARIWEAALSNKGKSSAAGPGGGNVACAWCVNRYAIMPAGLRPLGGGPSGSDAVDGILSDLKGGRGQKIPLSQVAAGDIWLVKGAHIGVFADNGKTVLSNSSSKASFNWIGSLESMNNYYRSPNNNEYWRVTS